MPYAGVKLQTGHKGFEKEIAITYGVAADERTNQKCIPKSFTHLSLIVVLTDTIPSGLPGLMMPLFCWFAKEPGKRASKKSSWKNIIANRF
jgi:hypothetical protein